MSANRILLGAIVACLLTGPALAATSHEGGANSSAGGDQAPASRQERLTSADSWLAVPTLTACILNRDTLDATIIVDMGIDVPDATLRRHANANGPRVRDALRTALTTYANTYYRMHTSPDPATITRLLQQAVDQTLGAQGGRVLLVNIMFQRRQGI